MFEKTGTCLSIFQRYREHYKAREKIDKNSILRVWKAWLNYFLKRPRVTWKWQTFHRSIYQRNSLRIPKINKIKKSPAHFNSIQFWNKKIYTYHQRHTGWLIFTFMIIIKKLKFLVNKLFFFSSNHYYCWHYIYI